MEIPAKSPSSCYKLCLSDSLSLSSAYPTSISANIFFELRELNDSAAPFLEGLFYEEDSYIV